MSSRSSAPPAPFLAAPDARHSELDAPHSELTLRLFGPFAATLHGLPLPRLRSRKEQHLLAILALRAPRPAERVWLAGTLWPESTQEAALANLRRSLHLLRTALGTQNAPRLHAPTPGTIALDLRGADVDVQTFDKALKTASTTLSPETLETAIRLYTAPLLQDCTEDWALTERAAREEGFLQACETLARHKRQAADTDGAAHLLRRALAVDPLRESVVRALMQILADSADAAGAMDTFRRFRRRLRREMDAAPAPETRALLGAITDALSPAPALSVRLPRPLTPLIGRRREVGESVSALDTSRLVTLTGTGGVGKTRLAIAAAEDIAEETQVCFVALASLTDPASIVSAVAHALEVTSPGDTTKVLVEHLRERSLLLVLDNCEHLLDGCALLIMALLEGCARLRVLATSRQALGLPGEAVFPVPLLALPPVQDAPLPEMEYAAVQLFVARAKAARSSFSADGRTLPAVVRICRRLDGLPLAIELAASRVRSLSCEQIADRLDDRFGLLAGGNRGALARHQTLRGAVDWSYDLLTEGERVLLGRVSVFAGGWTLEAAEAVCGEDGLAVSEALSGLVDKSLVQMQEQVQAEEKGGVRYFLLETLREYGQEKLVQSGEGEVLTRGHRDWFVALAEEAEPGLRGPDQGKWLSRLETEHDNLRGALECCASEATGGEAGLRLAGALWFFWYVRGYGRAGLRYLERALQNAADAPPRLYIKVLNGAGALAYAQGDPAARAYLEQGEAYSRRQDDRGGLSDALLNLGNLLYDAHDFAAARVRYAESLTLFRGLADRRGVARALVNLGLVGMEQKEYGAAQVQYEEGLSLFREMGDIQGMANAFVNLGLLAIEQHEYPLARERFADALRVCRKLNSPLGCVYALSGLAQVAGVQAQPERAARLWGAVEALREDLDAPLDVFDRQKQQQDVATAQAHIGEEVFTAAWMQGWSMTQEQAMDYALQEASFSTHALFPQ